VNDLEGYREFKTNFKQFVQTEPKKPGHKLKKLEKQLDTDGMSEDLQKYDLDDLFFDIEPKTFIESNKMGRNSNAISKENNETGNVSQIHSANPYISKYEHIHIDHFSKQNFEETLFSSPLVSNHVNHKAEQNFKMDLANTKLIQNYEKKILNNKLIHNSMLENENIHSDSENYSIPKYEEIYEMETTIQTSIEQLKEKIERLRKRKQDIENELENIMMMGNSIPNNISKERQNIENELPIIYKKMGEISRLTKTAPGEKEEKVAFGNLLQTAAFDEYSDIFLPDLDLIKNGLVSDKKVNSSIACIEADDIPLCNHGIPSICRTSKKETSIGRQFYCCSKGIDSVENCSFFKWKDETESVNTSDLISSSNYCHIYDNQLDIYGTLKNIFGHHRFRFGQENIIKMAMQGRDIFVLIPTGGGKSLCYQLPAVCCPGLSVVFSPLISLVQDQVQSLKMDGIKAASMCSDQDYKKEIAPVFDQLFHLQSYNGIKLLYITPEKLDKSPQLISALVRLYNKGLLSRFVIDEAHCLSDWGHDFRPDYLKLHVLREKFPSVPIMALTATANKKVVEDATRRLRMKDHILHSQSFNRPNLKYFIFKKTSKIIDDIAQVVCRYSDESGIVYCLSRNDCEDVSKRLTSHELISSKKNKN